MAQSSGVIRTLKNQLKLLVFLYLTMSRKLLDIGYYFTVYSFGTFRTERISRLRRNPQKCVFFSLRGACIKCEYLYNGGHVENLFLTDFFVKRIISTAIYKSLVAFLVTRQQVAPTEMIWLVHTK